MRNWNTDTSMFKDQTEKRIWEISQILEYGSEDGRLPEEDRA